MAHWPLLSLVTFLPLVGRAGDHDAARRRRRDVARNARWIALWTSLVDFALSLVDVGRRSIPSRADFQFVEKAAWLPDFNIAYHMGVDGISLFFVLLSTFLTPICVVASWDVDHQAGPGIHDRLPGARDDDGRHVLRARFRRVLHVLRGRADPDVPHHRRVGRAAPGLCRVQVLPLHAARLGADAAGDPRDLFRRPAPPTSPRRSPTTSRRRCRNGCGSPSSPPSRSRCRCGRCIPGCPTRMSRRRPRAR